MAEKLPVIMDDWGTMGLLPRCRTFPNGCAVDTGRARARE